MIKPGIVSAEPLRLTAVALAVPLIVTALALSVIPMVEPPLRTPLTVSGAPSFNWKPAAVKLAIVPI